MSCASSVVTLIEPLHGVRTVVEPACSVSTLLEAPAKPVMVTLVSPGGIGGGGGYAPAAPLAVTTNRDLTASDAGRVLQVANGLALDVPAGLPPSWAAQILMTAPHVWAGGALMLRPAPGVVINGASDTKWYVERAAGSALPWMAWLQRETGTDAYSLFAVGASLTSYPATAGDVYELGVYEIGAYE